MKAKSRLRSPLPQHRRAVALVIVLAILLLMSALLVAFMGTVSNEREASRTMTAGFEAKQAYETAVNLVISQIREATKNDDGSVGWASQPGAIHTFGTAPDANRVYKLYSAADMQQNESSYQPGSLSESGFDLSDPRRTPKGMVDINTPVYIPTAKAGVVEPHYPIADPRAGLLFTGADAPVPGKGVVEGFSSTKIEHYSLMENRAGGTPKVLQLPMRVRWIYQLKDGTLVAPDSDDIIKGASKINPPVARLAFWTDDESAKINVNTAGEGTYWDIPLASSYKESGKMKAGGNPGDSH